MGWLRTPTERQRDDYYTLYQKLDDAVSKNDRVVDEIQASYSSYRNSSPYLSPNRIPSNDFIDARSSLNDQLKQYFDYEKGRRTELIRARDRAYERYIYYRNQVIREEAEAKESKAK